MMLAERVDSEEKVDIEDSELVELVRESVCCGGGGDGTEVEAVTSVAFSFPFPSSPSSIDSQATLSLLLK
jgi:hypothetical protein